LHKPQLASIFNSIKTSICKFANQSSKLSTCIKRKKAKWSTINECQKIIKAKYKQIMFLLYFSRSAWLLSWAPYDKPNKSYTTNFKLIFTNLFSRDDASNKAYKLNVFRSICIDIHFMIKLTIKTLNLYPCQVNRHNEVILTSSLTKRRKVL